MTQAWPHICNDVDTENAISRWVTGKDCKKKKDDRKAITVVFFEKHILVKERSAQGTDIRKMTMKSVNQYY